jgi:hypothetical protein
VLSNDYPYGQSSFGLVQCLLGEGASERWTFLLLRMMPSQYHLGYPLIRANTFPLAMAADIIVNPIDPLLLDDTHQRAPSCGLKP